MVWASLRYNVTALHASAKAETKVAAAHLRLYRRARKTGNYSFRSTSAEFLLPNAIQFASAYSEARFRATFGM